MDDLIDMSEMDKKWTELVMEELADFMNERNLRVYDVHAILDTFVDDEYSHIIKAWEVCKECGDETDWSQLSAYNGLCADCYFRKAIKEDKRR